MARQILTPEQVENVKDLLGYVDCAIDNLFAGLQDAPTGIYDCPECFTKRDIKVIERAGDVVQRLRDNFDGTRKQR